MALNDRSRQTVESIAAELVLLNPTDPRACTRIHDMFKDLGEDPSTTDKIRQLAVRATAVAHKLVFEEYDSPESGAKELENLISLMQTLEEKAEVEGTTSAQDSDKETGTVLTEHPSKDTSEKPAPSVSKMGEEQRFTLPENIDTTLIGEFQGESLEHIENAEAALLNLEIDPEDKESVDIVFRAFHTIKGIASFLGFEYLTELAHNAETFLDRARKGDIALVEAYADLAFQGLDGLKFLIEDLPDSISRGHAKPCPNYDYLRQVLNHPEEFAVKGKFEHATEKQTVGEILVESGAASLKDVEEAANEQARGDERPLGEILVRKGDVAAQDVAQALRRQKSPTTSISMKSKEADVTVKVSTTRLDNLVNEVGELVIAEAMVSQDKLIRTSVDQQLNRKVVHLAKITRSLQELALSMRMVSVKSTFQKMARLVRDLARKSGKEVVLTLAGEETELDRNMVEAIADPLVHLVRNAVDHGIESPDERRKLGKPPTGQIVLGAKHKGGGVVITLRDDGGGLDAEKIRLKAIERGLITPDIELTNAEIHHLIFQAGFSTTAKVTDVSGRGVGMDVVRSNIEKLRGTVEISSTPGKGSIFTLRLPLTLAIIEGMVVRVGSERYIIPTIVINESLRPTDDSVFSVQQKGKMILWRGSLVPLYPLHSMFNINDALQDPTEAILVVAESNTKRCAIMVDEIVDQQQVVIKNLGTIFERVKGVSGGAIMGDGRVALILDIEGIISTAENTL